MIISRTPFRISFMGGGTDLPSFYEMEDGLVISTAINKYMHITINDRFDSTYRLSYSKTEICDKVEQIEHPIFRTVLKKHWTAKEQGLEVISMADIPSGTGLGSSSSFTVGLLNALHSHQGRPQTAEALAAEASRIEIQDLGEPIGKQDQYAAAFGGLQTIRFLPSGDVETNPVVCSESTYKELESSVMMFYTGVTRSASKVLTEQKKNTVSKRDVLREMKNGALKLKKILEESKGLKSFGEVMHEGWLLKKSLATGISTTNIDEWYERGLKAGALGGKVLGAGGGGFLMFVCPLEKQKDVKEELKELRQIPVKFERFGSKIIFVG